jgi:hypothetical protein
MLMVGDTAANVTQRSRTINLGVTQVTRVYYATSSVIYIPFQGVSQELLRMVQTTTNSSLAQKTGQGLGPEAELRPGAGHREWSPDGAIIFKRLG